MYNFPIGVMIDSFRLPIKDAIAKAVSIGAAGFQMYATYGEHSPEKTAARYGVSFSSKCERITAL